MVSTRRKKPKTLQLPTNSPSSSYFNEVTDKPVQSMSDRVEERAREAKIVTSLNAYWREADNNRKSGMNPRDDKWRENLNLYWNRVDFSKKANWQAKETMPEVPAYVDRFAGALKEAIVSLPDGFYTVTDPADTEGDIADAIKGMTDVWLSKVGRNQYGQPLPFASVFEEQIKLGALMAMSQVVLWKDDIPNGRVAIETVDPRNVWMDHTFRNLYRIRRTEIDRHDIGYLTKQVDSKGRPLFNPNEVANLVAGISYLEQQQKMELTGTGQMNLSGRTPIVLDEYIATVVDETGEVIADRALFVVANQQYLIRGPEKNPFWHGADWLVFTPLVTAPLSVYGRSYMEDFGSVATTFTELTNMILDAVHTLALKAFVVVPGMLMNPEQLSEGITPNKTFLLEDGYKAEDFATALDLGNLNADVVKVWSAIKSELSEAAAMNEIGLGQFAPNARTSATEIRETTQSGSQLIRSVADTVETRYLDPTLDLVWKTGLQHAKANDPMLIRAAGEDMVQALFAERRSLIKRPVTFQARGLSQMIQKSNTLKSLLGVMQMISGNPVLTQMFMQEISLPKLINKLFELSNIDLSKLKMSEREKMIQQVAQPMMQAGAQMPPGGMGPNNTGPQPAMPPQGGATNHPPQQAAAPHGRAHSGPHAQQQMQQMVNQLGIGR